MLLFMLCFNLNNICVAYIIIGECDVIILFFFLCNVYLLFNLTQFSMKRIHCINAILLWLTSVNEMPQIHFQQPNFAVISIFCKYYVLNKVIKFSTDLEKELSVIINISSTTIAYFKLNYALIFCSPFFI